VWTLNGVEQRVDFYSDSMLTPSAFRTLSSGPEIYDLSGSGIASAMVNHDGVLTRLDGSCSLNVQLGASVAPTWDGSFYISHYGTYPAPSDSLAFQAGGTIQTDGTFTGNQVSYNLYIHETRFDRTTITAESISGHTVGTGTGATPITGAIGSFSFTHGAAAQVNGGFGADIGAPAP
jgi:hypothetical protein